MGVSPPGERGSAGSQGAASLLFGPAEPPRWAAWLLPPIAAAVTFFWHWTWLRADDSLPVGDAGGHLVNVARHLAWLGGNALPAESFPPGYYTLAALAVRQFGTELDVVVGTTAAFAALLAFALSWAGARTSVAAGILAPAFALAAPMVSTTTRQVLLDVPVTAIIAVIWALVYASEGFRRPLPTLLTGAALAAGALVKYTLFPWVLPVLVLAGAWMVVRAPLAVLPLGLVGPPALATFEALKLRAADDPVREPLTAQVLRAVNATNCAWLGSALLVALACTFAKRRWSRLQGVADGAWLAAAAILAITLVAPWFLHAMPVVWEKVQREAIDEVRTTDLATATVFVRAMVLRSWPQAWWLVQTAVVLEAVWIVRGLSRWRAEPRFGPTIPIVIACAFGTWFTVHNLPVDVRYYLPLLVGTCLVLGTGLGRTRVGSWVATPLVLGLLGWQLYADRLGDPHRLDSAGFDGARTERLGAWGPFAPPTPSASPLARSVQTLIREIATLNADCDAKVVLVVPRFHEGRSVGIEDRSLAAIAQLHGVRECALQTVEVGQPVPAGRWIAVAGVRTAEAPTGTFTWQKTVAGRLVAIGAME